MARQLRGVVGSGTRDAVTWPIDVIRKLVERPNLYEGTLNVELSTPYELSPDYTLAQEENNRPEALYFEECQLHLGADIISALIARTSTNFHGSTVLEIMANIHLRNKYGLVDGSEVIVEVEDDGD